MKNFELFKQVADMVVGDEARLNMGSWITTLYPSAETREEAVCKTTACIAGWACILSGAAEFEESNSCGVDDCEYCDGLPLMKRWIEPREGWASAAVDALGSSSQAEQDAMYVLFYTTDARALEVLRRVSEGEDLTSVVGEVA